MDGEVLTNIEKESRPMYMVVVVVIVEDLQCEVSEYGSAH